MVLGAEIVVAHIFQTAPSPALEGRRKPPAGMVSAEARDPSILTLAWMTESAASRSTTVMDAPSPISG